MNYRCQHLSSKFTQKWNTVTIDSTSCCSKPAGLSSFFYGPQKMQIRSTVSSKDVSEDRFIHEGKCQEHDEHSASYMDQFYDTHMVFSEVVMNSLKNKKRSVRCIKKLDFIRHAQWLFFVMWLVKFSSFCVFCIERNSIKMCKWWAFSFVVNYPLKQCWF